uniref:TIR domain-containing protein n=1 Tax=Anopheles culicifacies TaxID=139723 RepID=A0A182LSJ0_9DIPT
MNDLVKKVDYFMYRYFSNNVTLVMYVNLLIEDLDEPFFAAIGEYVKEVHITHSKALKSISGLISPNISHLEVRQTSLHSIEFEENNALSHLIISHSNLKALSPTINGLRASERIEITYAYLQAIDLAKFANSVRIVCTADSVCQIYDACTSADFFVHQYIPTNVNTVRYLNLDMELVNATFFNTLPAFVTKVHILQSKHTKWFVVPGLSNISELSFAYTGLSRIEMDENYVLTSFDVASSKLVRVPSTINNLRACVRIEVTSSLIKELDMGVFCDMPKLKLLNLYGNRIVYLNNSATSNCSVYDSLQVIVLTRNLLKTLNMEVFDPFRAINKLTVNENRIAEVVGSFGSDLDLELFLSKNKIQSIALCDWNVPRVTWFDLQHNKLTTVPDCLENLNRATHFILAFNQITHVNIESFAGMASLMNLELSNNSISSIQLSSTRYPPKLQHLWIEGNNITEIVLSVVAVNSLVIDVQSNFIKSMDVDQISPNVSRLCMAGNPIDCSWKSLQDKNILKGVYQYYVEYIKS